jgi:hypothetical protein
MAIEEGNVVNYEGINYKVLSFRKGLGNSELAAEIQNVEDGSLRYVFIRDLEKRNYFGLTDMHQACVDPERLFSEFKNDINNDDNTNIWKVG